MQVKKFSTYLYGCRKLEYNEDNLLPYCEPNIKNEKALISGNMEC